MPLFWRYLIKEYLKVLSLVLFSFISILIVSRLEEVATLASMGGTLKLILTVVLLQIPYIWPIAMPIGALVSAITLFRRLSQTFELTAFRTHGFSLTQIATPILCTSCLLGIFNFYICSELSTEAHLLSKQMIYQHTSVNPLLLLQNAKIAQLKSGYVEMQPSKQGQSAQNLLIALPGREEYNLNLFLAKKVKIKNESLIAENSTFITTLPHDHLVIENQTTSSVIASDFAHLLRKSKWKIANDHLKFNYLLAKMRAFKNAKISFFEKNVQKCYSEIMRRFSLTLAPFIFTFMGIAFGMQHSRKEGKKSIMVVLILAFVFLACFFAGKEFDSNFFLATVLFFAPHVLLFYFSQRKMRLVQRGALC